MLAQQQMYKSEMWNCSFPFGDYIVDRWETAREHGFGEGISIYDSGLLLGAVAVGGNTWFVPPTVLDGSGGLVVGDHSSISAGVQIYTHDTVKRAVNDGVYPLEHAPLRISNPCYICPNVIIGKGVTIGGCCVIGANSLVNSDLPVETKAWGAPASVIN